MRSGIRLPMVESHAIAVHVDFTVTESLESEWRLCKVMRAMRISSNTKKIIAQAVRGEKSSVMSWVTASDKLAIMQAPVSLAGHACVGRHLIRAIPPI